MVMATMKVTTTMSAAAAALKNSIRKYYMNERCTLKFSEKRGHAYRMFTLEWILAPQIADLIAFLTREDGRAEHFEDLI